MLELEHAGDGKVILVGRLDAAQARKAQEFLDGIDHPRELDCARLEYISSAGLGILLRTQKRVMAKGGGLRLVNVSNHIRDVFRYSGFDKIFDIVSVADSGQ
jgi:anti-sigma B factor antagonist